MTNITRVFKLSELVFEEVDVSFVVVEQESHDVLSVDHPLQLRPFVGCKCNYIEVVFINDFN